MELDEICSRLDGEYFVDLGLEVTRKTAKTWEATCPFCGARKKFNLEPHKLIWQCFKCGEGGNAITYYSKLHRCSNAQAVRFIKDKLGIEDEPYKPQIKRHSGLSGGRPAGKLQLAPPKVEPYDRLLELAHLTEAHREELHDKRGFTDQTIDTFKLRSCGAYLAAIIERLKDEYGPDKLLKAGILNKVNGAIVMEEQLLQEKVLIPYLDEQGKAYHLRPHKLGFKQQQAQVFSRQMLQKRPAKVVLTEGEFKAMALWQWQIPAIAVPGISSFGGKNFSRLVELLKASGVQKVVVIFDSEEKGNPAYPNFKERTDDRYDTQYWSYMMAYKLTREGIYSQIGWLPAGWRINGKIDFDGALAQGHSRQEIMQVVNTSMTPQEFIESLDEDGQRVVRKKVAKSFVKTNIRREYTHYTAIQSDKDGRELERPISNFIINIKSNYFIDDQVIRNVELINDYGEHSKTFAIDSGSMAGVDSFKKFVMGKGNYIFWGNANDLTNIWRYELSANDGELIYMPEQIGWIDGYKLWLFGNMAVKDGVIYRPDDDGIIWVEGKGYKPLSFTMTASGGATEDSIPCLSEHAIDIQDIADKLKHTVGGYEAYMGLGWVVATIFSADIFKTYKCIPLLFPHGRRESGKTTFMRWLMRFFGIETEGITIGKITTQNFIVRALSYWSSLGVWLDEYRNEPSVTDKDGYFRSAYNRQISGKGTATSFQTKNFTVHGTLAISGEELPKDNGLFTRLIPLQFSDRKRDPQWFDWINRQQEYFSNFVLHLITHYDALKPQILANIKALKDALVAKGVTNRTAENWAICAAAFETTVMEDDAFIAWVEQNCQEIKQTGEQEHMLNQFWEDVNYLASEGTVNANHIKVVDTKDGERKIAIWFAGLYETWGLHYKKKTGREPFDKQSILKYMQDEAYYEPPRNIRLGKTVRKAIHINVDKATEAIEEIFEAFSLQIE